MEQSKKDISEIELVGMHVIVKATKNRKEIADRVYYCKHGFGCNPAASGTKIYGQFMSNQKDVYIRRENVERLATEAEITLAREKLLTLVKDELCTCGHLKSEHGGLQGHGVCSCAILRVEKNKGEGRMKPKKEKEVFHFPSTEDANEINVCSWVDDEKCPCVKFTWAKWVLKSKEDVSDDFKKAMPEFCACGKEKEQCIVCGVEYCVGCQGIHECERDADEDFQRAMPELAREMKFGN